MTATRPVTTPNLYFAPPCAKPADHHDTPHKDGRLFNATQKNNHAAPSNDTLRTRIDRHNASDVRGQGGVTPRALGVAGSLVTAQRRRSTAAHWGHSYFRPSNACTAPFRVAITTALFAESRFFHACFFRVMLWVRAAAGGLRFVMWPRGQGE